MKKTLLALAAAFAAVGAQAATVTVIDGFDSPGVSISGTGNSTDPVRSVSVTATAATSSLDIGATSSTGSALEVSNRVNQDSTVNLTWTLAALTLPGDALNVGFFFRVLASDGNPTSLAFTLNGNALTSFNIPGNTINQDLSFGLSAPELASLVSGGTLGLQLDGALGWDLALDTFGVSYEQPVTPPAVPEPGSLALVGLALAGVAAARRKKA